MNPAFIVLIILGALAIWFLASPAFAILGNIICKIWKGAVDEINENDEREEKEE